MRKFRRRRRLPAALLYGLPLAAAIVLIAGLVNQKVAPLVGAVAEMEARRTALEVMNRAVAGGVVTEVRPGDLVSYRTDGQGMVTVLQTDTAQINRLVGRAVTAVEQELGKLKERQFHVPLGELLHSPFLAHSGPRLPVTFVPVGAVTAAYRHRFEEAGINQTRHLIVVELQAQVRVVLPLVVREVTVSTELPLAETIIAGRVPQQYWQGGAPVRPTGPEGGRP